VLIGDTLHVTPRGIQAESQSRQDQAVVVFEQRAWNQAR